MSLRNCIVCGKLCLDNPSRMCPDCVAKEHEAEDMVARYIRDKGKTTITEIHEATGVEEKVILRMIKQGRVYADGIVEYPCETCGKGILEGRLCAECSQRITSQIKHDDWQPAGQQVSSRQSLGMYSQSPRNK